jgi:signal transduction histidine kinase
MTQHRHAATHAQPPGSRSTPFAWSIWALVVAMFLIGGWASLHQNGPIALSPSSLSDTIYLAVVIGLPYTTIGALIASRQPKNAVGWTLLTVGAIATLGQFLGTISNSNHPGNLTIAAISAGANEIAWMLAPVLVLTLVPLIFPDGHAPGIRWTWLYGVAALAAGCVLVASLAEGWTTRTEIAAGATTLPDPGGNILIVLFVALLATVVGTIGAFAALVVRYRHARANEREQLKWFFFGLLIVVITTVFEMTVISGSPLEQIVWLATLALPISIAIGILRYRLFDIDLIVSRTLLWVLLSGFVVGAYVLIVGVVGTRFADSHDLALSLLTTAIVAICFQPVRQWLQQAINRFVYGDRDDPYAAIARLGRRLDAITTPDELLPTIVETVAQALKLPYAAITLRSDSSLAPAVSYGALPERGQLLTRPLTYNAEPVGELILAPRTPTESLAASDLRLLDDLTRQIGVAAHTVQLTADLQRSREQLVIAREEERRRIRNDLHDGLGPVLSGLKLRAETVRNLVVDNPQVDALLDDIAARTETAVSDVRRLVYSLRPPALDDLGLGAALQELGAQTALPVTVTLPNPMPPVSAAVEVAVFRIAQEALTNVARHADATTAHIELRIDPDQLAMSISDDGRGLPPETRAGVGLRSMRERVSELGGAMTIESSDGLGSTIRITIPMTPVFANEPLNGH